MHHSCWHTEHIWDYAIHLYATGEDGIKAVTKKLGLSHCNLALRLKGRGIPKKMHHSTKLKLSGLAQINLRNRELKRRFESMLRRVRMPLKKRITQMERYYAQHERSKKIGRLNAAKRHARLKQTAEYKVHRAARNCINRIVRMVGYGRKPKTRTHEFLGCDYPTARTHLEARFKPGMGWHNHGTEWEIDHIKPIAAFNLMDEIQRMAAMHYTNLQPLWKQENRSKAAKWCAVA